MHFDLTSVTQLNSAKNDGRHVCLQWTVNFTINKTLWHRSYANGTVGTFRKNIYSWSNNSYCIYCKGSFTVWLNLLLAGTTNGHTQMSEQQIFMVCHQHRLVQSCSTLLVWIILILNLNSVKTNFIVLTITVVVFRRTIRPVIMVVLLDYRLTLTDLLPADLSDFSDEANSMYCKVQCLS